MAANTSTPHLAPVPRPTPGPEGLLEKYRRLRQAGVEQVNQGHFGEAEPLLREAHLIARELGEARRTDRAFCNWASVRIALGEVDHILPDLREILVRSDDAANCRFAAYHISRIYEMDGEVRKGLFYARIARDRTAQIKNPDPTWIASNHNQIANFLVADSRFEDALQEYSRALAAQPDVNGYRVPGFHQNMGYCELMLGRPKEAFRLLFSSLRAYRRMGARSLLGLNHLDLAYAYLEVGRPERAVRHAETALELAHEGGSPTNLKNALYLLGEACHLSGDEERARLHFERLSACYEDLPFIADLLLTVDVRQMINLRA